jgi:hypothetical protein
MPDMMLQQAHTTDARILYQQLRAPLMAQGGVKHMSGFFDSVTGNVITGIIALPIGAAAQAGYSYGTARFRSRPTVDLFGIKTGPVTIIHSTIFDSARVAYNYPSADARSSRGLARLLSDAHRREDHDFFVRADVDVIKSQRVDPSLWRGNLILLCGPKRNPVVAEALSRLPPSRLKYTMSVDTDTNLTVLRDNVRNHWLRSSLEEAQLGHATDDKYDYGLILSVRNPFHSNTTVTILAGLHGTGTIGCVDFLNDRKNVRKLLQKRDNGVICEVVKVTYGDDFEAITNIEIA